VNKAELIESVARQLGKDTSKAEGERAVNAVIDSIRKGLKKDKAVQLIGFGTFSVKNRKARLGKNPATGATIQIPASRTVAFKCGKDLKNSL